MLQNRTSFTRPSEAQQTLLNGEFAYRFESEIRQRYVSAAMETKDTLNESMFIFEKSNGQLIIIVVVKSRLHKPAERKIVRRHGINNINGSPIFPSHAFPIGFYWAKQKRPRNFLSQIVTGGRRAGSICEIRDIFDYVCAHIPPRNLIQCCLAHFDDAVNRMRRHLFLSFSFIFEIMLRFVVGFCRIRLLFRFLE